MEGWILDKTFWGRRIVLYPGSLSGADPFCASKCVSVTSGEYTWREAAPARAQRAYLWSLNCRTGSQGREFQRRALHVLCNSWIRPPFSRIHARAGGIGEAPSESKNVAAICGIDTPLVFSAGVRGGSFPTA